jgi:RNA polymerase sigma-32 factor
MGAVRREGVPGWRQRVQDAERLDAETERGLVVAAQAGDALARRRLIEANLRLVLGLAMKLRRYGVPVAELMSEGTLGLCEALDRFDVERKLRFSTYAAAWVRAHVLQRLAAEMSPQGSARGAFRTKYWFLLRREKARLSTQGLSQDEMLAPLSARLGVSEAKVAEMLAHLRQRAVPVLDEREEDSPGAVLADAAPTPDEIASRRQHQAHLEEAVAAALDTLDDRDAELIRRRLMDDGPSLAAFGREMGISRERVRQLEARSKARLRQRLKHFAPEAA